jgi:DNA-binding IclR family transcriptional regulator
MRDVNVAVDRRDRVGSVESAFHVLEAVAEHQPIGVGALSRRLGIPKTTVQRALRTMSSLRYVAPEGDPTRWRLTLRAFHVGIKASAMSLRDYAIPEMRRLLEQTEEAIHLTVLEGRHVVVVEKLDSSRGVRAYTERGEYLPANSSATGKAILAVSPESIVARFLADPLLKLTERTIVDPIKFRAELEITKARGYGLNIGERRPDVNALGAIIRDASGAPIAGLGISAPSVRFPPNRLAITAELVIAAANRVAHRLGWNGNQP